METYDSKIEQHYHQQHSHLERQTSYLPTSFIDSEGTSFKAKADYYDPIIDTFIEVKNHQLNNYKTKQSSKDRLMQLEQYKGYLTNKGKLLNDWNHSLYKHLIVQQTLELLNIKYLVVFYRLSDPLTKQALNKMNCLGLNYTIQ